MVKSRNKHRKLQSSSSCSGEFSESELDAARQLVQLSVSGSCSSGVAYDGEDDGAGASHEASSALRVVVAAAEDDHGGEWQPLDQRTKKYRSVEQIYAATLRLDDPLDKKKRKCKC